MMTPLGFEMPRAIWGLVLAWGLASSQGWAYSEIEIKEGGTLHGVVSFAGPAPAPGTLTVDKDKEVFGGSLPDETLLVSASGKMANVVVTIEGVPQGKRWPELKFVLENRGGRFLPHVQVVRAGAQLEIVNRDPVFHQAHAYLDDRTVFNLALPVQGLMIKRPLKKPGIVEVVCDAHKWMSAWVVVQEHPYFAVTDPEGNYFIGELSPGNYGVTAWHEKLGTIKKQVRLEAGERHRLDFALPPATAR